MEENKLFALKLIGFNPNESSMLNAILTLAERSLKAKWQIVETESADFFLLSATSSKQINQDPVLQKLPRQNCLFCVTQDTNSLETDNTLSVDSKNIPGLQALVKLFNQLTEQKPHANTHQNSSTARTSETNNEQAFFDFEKGFLGSLLNTKEEIFVINLPSHPDYAPVYINDMENSYYSCHDLTGLDDYLKTTTDKLSIKSCTENELKTYAETQKLKSKPLKDLIWYIAIKTSNGKVIKGYSSSDIITLKKWPDLRLPGCLGYAKLATFMKNNAATLQTVFEHTKIPLSEIYAFYNACYLIGLVEIKREASVNKRNIDPERLKLLSQINNRLEN